jgi:Nuclease-related domain
MGCAMVPTTVSAVTARRGGAKASLRIVAAAAQLHRWATAAEGRRRTERVLRALDPAGWQVAHQIALPGGGHVDHLVVGLGGVYLLDSRAWHGVVTVDQKGATITPGDDPGAAWTARGQHQSLPPAAAAVVRALSAATGHPLPAPCAVVVIWAPFPERVAVSCGVTYIAGEQLGDWLTGQPSRLDRQRVAAMPVGRVAIELWPGG